MQLTGSASITFYSFTLFTYINQSHPTFNPTTSSVLITTSMIVGQILSIFPPRYFKRTTIIRSGYLMISICYIFAAISYRAGNPTVMLGCLMMMQVTFIMTIQSHIWPYVSEIVQDSVLGFCIQFNFVGILMNTFSAQTLFEVLQPWGVFYLFACTCMMGFFYAIFVLKETDHLTQEQKKMVYCQKNEMLF